ncbi:MAG: hypothetical protein ACYS15_08820 [Planctomycetota bacterium]|jgi:hypothetical protein
MTRRTITTCLGLALLLAAATLTGCSRKGVSGEKTDTGFFTGYEMGNEQDQTEVRQERPGYRPHE